MGPKMRYSIACVCTVASVPGAFSGPIGTFFVAADGCGARESNYGRGGSLILAAVIFVVLVLAWVGYFDLMSSWVANRKAQRQVVIGAPAAALSWILMSMWIARDPDCTLQLAACQH
jgi:hypothetical protein